MRKSLRFNEKIFIFQILGPKTLIRLVEKLLPEKDIADENA